MSHDHHLKADMHARWVEEIDPIQKARLPDDIMSLLTPSITGAVAKFTASDPAIDLDDIQQNAMLQVMRSLPTFDKSKSSLTTWANMVAKRRTIDYISYGSMGLAPSSWAKLKTRAARSASAEAHSQPTCFDAPAGDDTDDTIGDVAFLQLAGADRRQRTEVDFRSLWNALLDQLTTEQQAILYHWVEGYGLNDIGKILGITGKRVDNLMQQIKHKAIAIRLAEDGSIRTFEDGSIKSA